MNAIVTRHLIIDTDDKSCQCASLFFFIVTSTCAGYDDDAQICCEHGGEGGQNVSLTAEVHETRMTGGGG